MRAFALLLITTFAASASAGQPATSAKQTSVPPKIAHPARAAQTMQSKAPAMPDQVQQAPLLSASLAYGLETDLARDTAPRLFSNAISADLSLNAWDLFNVDLGAGIEYESVGTQIGSEDRLFGPTDLTVGISRGFELSEGSPPTHSVRLATGTAIPLSDESTHRGFIAIPFAGAGLSSKFASFYTLRNSVTASYIINTYEYSPTDDTPNPTAGIRYKLTNAFTFLKHFEFVVDFGIKFTNHTDGFTDYSYMNREALSYSLKPFAIGLSYTNGGYTDEGRMQPWYIDEYRRTVAMEVSLGL